MSNSLHLEGTPFCLSADVMLSCRWDLECGTALPGGDAEPMAAVAGCFATLGMGSIL